MFDAEGKFIRAFGQEFQGGGHGLEVHDENGEEFLYVTGYQGLKKFAKLTLKGEHRLGTARADGIRHLRRRRRQKQRRPA